MVSNRTDWIDPPTAGVPAASLRALGGQQALLLALTLALGLLARILYANLLWQEGFRSPDDTLAKMYVRSSYLMAAGLGYSQVISDCPARTDLIALQQEARKGRPVTPADASRIRPQGLHPEMLHPPAWAWIGAEGHRLTGLSACMVLQTLGVVLDTLTILLVFVLVRTAAGGFGLPFAVCLLYATFPPVLAIAADLMPTVVVCHLAAWSALLMLHAARARTAGRRWLWILAVGLVGGLSGYFRPDYILLGPFLALGLWIATRRFLESAAAGAVIGLVTLAALLPWALRNRELCGRWVFTSCSVGPTLVNGLGAYPNPWKLGPSDFDRHREARAAGFETAFCPEADLHFRKVYWDCVRQHPSAMVGILARRSVEVLLPAHGWGLAKPKAATYSQIRHRGKIMDSLAHLVRTYWPQVISAGLMLAGWVGCFWMWLRRRRSNPALIIPILLPVYAALSHIPTLLLPYYLMPGLAVQLMGLAWLGQQVFVRKSQGNA